MPIELRWLVVPAVTGLYTAGLSENTPLVDPGLSQARAGPIGAFCQACTADGIDVQRLIDHLIFYAADAPCNSTDPGTITRQTRSALLKAAGSQGALRAATIAPLVQAVVEAVARPNLAAELELRIGPLAEQWEARGPGLLAQLARLTEPQAIVDRATVLPVYPVSGGGGRSLPAYNMAVIEAVLANPRAELPEVIRLAWLLGMLNFDLPRCREPLTDPDRVLPLAMVPPVLAAAAEVELARCDVGTVELALRHWRVPEREPAATAATLMAWWQTVVETRPAWTLAVVALERMLV